MSVFFLFRFSPSRKVRIIWCSSGKHPRCYSILFYNGLVCAEKNLAFPTIADLIALFIGNPNCWVSRSRIIRIIIISRFYSIPSSFPSHLPGIIVDRYVYHERRTIALRNFGLVMPVSEFLWNHSLTTVLVLPPPSLILWYTYICVCVCMCECVCVLFFVIFTLSSLSAIFFSPRNRAQQPAADLR